MCGWGLGDVPAVSRARRRIERLRGVQFCRRAREIRSEVSAPARLCPRRRAEKKRRVNASWDLVRAGGVMARRGTALEELGYGGLCPHPLRKLSFLRTFLLLLPLWTNVVPRLNRRRKPRPPRRSAVALYFACTRNCILSGQAATTAAQPASLKRGSDCVQAQPAQTLSTNFNRS